MKKQSGMNSEKDIPNVILARATVADMRFLFNLRNDPGVRAVSFNNNPIQWDEHRKWLLKTIENPNSCLFVVKVNRRRVGQVRVDLHVGYGEISVSIAAAYRGKGFAKISIDRVGRYVFKKYPKIKKIFAYIKPENIVSIKTFEKAGFSRQSNVKHKGNRALKMALIR